MSFTIIGMLNYESEQDRKDAIANCTTELVARVAAEAQEAAASYSTSERPVYIR